MTDAEKRLRDGAQAKHILGMEVWTETVAALRADLVNKMLRLKGVEPILLNIERDTIIHEVNAIDKFEQRLRTIVAMAEAENNKGRGGIA